MERKRRITLPTGDTIMGTELGFRVGGEYWNEYLLDDGTVIRVKLVVTGVCRLDGKVDEKGQPAYLVNSKNVLAVSAAGEE